MKVLYVYDCLRQRNGVTAVIMNYLRHFPRNGSRFDLLIYRGSEPEMVALAESLGAQVHFMPELRPTSAFRFVSFLKSFFAAHPYDIVHSHFNQIDFLLFPVARKHGVRHCISHSHNTRFSPRKLRAIRNRILCWNIARNADTLAACSEAAGRALFGPVFATSPKKLIVKNGVPVRNFVFDPKARGEIRSEFNVAPDELLLGHVGSFRLQKNHAFLLSLFARLVKRDARYRLLLVGNGGLEKEIRSQIESLDIGTSVILAGSRSDVPRLLSAMDIFLFPSLYEGLSVSLVEVQISGLPCFASRSVSSETSFTDLVRFLPLDQDAWERAVLALEPAARRSRTEEAVAAGYEIAGNAENLYAYYEGILTK